MGQTDVVAKSPETGMDQKYPQNHNRDKVQKAFGGLKVQIGDIPNGLVLLGREDRHANPVLKLVGRVLANALLTPLTGKLTYDYDKVKADAAKQAVQVTFYPEPLVKKKNSYKNELRKIINAWAAVNATHMNSNAFLEGRVEFLRKVTDYLETFDTAADKGSVEPIFQLIKQYNDKQPN